MICAVLSFLAVGMCKAESYDEGDERLGYVSIGSDGATAITFNATSIQNAVILGLFVLVLGALVLPLFGISLSSLFGSGSDSDSGYGYSGYDQTGYDTGYEAPATNYQAFAKRSIQMLSPVLDALSSAQRKYD